MASAKLKPIYNIEQRYKKNIIYKIVLSLKKYLKKLEIVLYPGYINI